MSSCIPQRKKPENVSEINLWSDDWEDWEDEDGCYNGTLFDFTFQKKLYLQVSYIVSVLMIIVSCLGLFGNIINILVLSRGIMNNCFNKILIAINVCDSVHLVFAILDGVRSSFIEYYPLWLLQTFPFTHYPIYRISMVGSIFLVISVAIERHSAVCNPLAYRQQHTGKWRAFSYIFPSCLMAFIVNITRFLETEADRVCIDFSRCGKCAQEPYYNYRIRPTVMRLNKIYITYQSWSWILLTGVIPFSILMVLNFKILANIRRLRARIAHKKLSNVSAGSPKGYSQQSKDINMSLVLVSTVAMFFFCHTPRLFVSLYEAINIHSIQLCQKKGKINTPTWFMFVTLAVQLLMVVNAAFNLPVYFFAGHHFRDALYQLLGFKPSLPGNDVDSPKVQLKNVNKISEHNITRLESVVKNTTSQENNNVAVTQL